MHGMTRMTWSKLDYFSYKPITTLKNAQKMTSFSLSFHAWNTRFCFAKLLKIWFDVNYCSSCINNLKNPMKSNLFAWETDFIPISCICLCGMLSTASTDRTADISRELWSILYYLVTVFVMIQKYLAAMLYWYNIPSKF